MWEQIGGEGVVFRTPWPIADEDLARESEMEIPVQVNGKLVSVLKFPVGLAEDAIKAAAQQDEKVAARIAGKNVVKVIMVPGKLVNLVVK
jgi:leucyl-tRNA synthetase